jgi:hypothetical protein
LDSDFELLLESDEDELDELESLAPGFDDEYRSEYQPPPFRVKVVALIIFSTFFALHFGQTRIGLSDIFCHSSNWWPQAPQAYS